MYEGRVVMRNIEFEKLFDPDLVHNFKVWLLHNSSWVNPDYSILGWATKNNHELETIWKVQMVNYVPYTYMIESFSSQINVWWDKLYFDKSIDKKYLVSLLFDKCSDCVEVWLPDIGKENLYQNKHILYDLFYYHVDNIDKWWDSKWFLEYNNKYKFDFPNRAISEILRVIRDRKDEFNLEVLNVLANRT
jgi:hypothetical protein